MTIQLTLENICYQSRPLDRYIVPVAEEAGNEVSSSFTILWSSDDQYSTDNQAQYLTEFFSGLTKGKTYLFRVATSNDAGTGPLNDAGIGPFSAAVSNDAITVPASPVALEAAVQNPFQINLQWLRPPDDGFFENDLALLVRHSSQKSVCY